MNRRELSVTERQSRRQGRHGRAAWRVLLAACVACAAWPGMTHAQNAEWLDARVTQATIVDTICVPGYVDRVLPSFEEQMKQKAKLLKQRSIDESFASEYALDHRMPILLGGSPGAAANLDLRCWEGRAGQRRKERLAVFLKRCVCTGDLSLKAAQAAIAGDWPDRYSNLSSLTCSGF
ncbi:hypothetical protein BHUM_03856c [Candidatus Burkholderia humilis]|nr:hypothetical protein BHUM_03856c [Candidatus Burkholderia humilis]